MTGGAGDSVLEQRGAVPQPIGGGSSVGGPLGLLAPDQLHHHQPQPARRGVTPPHQPQPPANSPDPAYHHVYSPINGAVYTDVQATPHVIHGSTTLGQIGVSVCPPLAPQGAELSPCPTTPGTAGTASGDECDSGSDMHGSTGGGARSRKQKRGVLPKHATSVMRSWLFQHLVVSSFIFYFGR